MKTPFLVLTLTAALAISGCGQSAPRPATTAGPTPAAGSEKPREEPFTPGLGEIMTLQQMRHTKLWLAGQADNWDLANYEIKELREGFDDVLKFHPTHEESPVAPKDAIPRIIDVPITDVQAAVEAKDKKVFEQKFDALTKGCNDCHNAMNFGFNVVQRPASNPYPNQNFAPQRR